MATKMNPMAGRYFNSPAFANAASNLASAFAGPSIDEYLTGAQYQGEMLTNRARGDMYNAAGGDFDKLGVIADLYDPSGSYYAVDQSNATERRGQDIASGDRRYGVDVGSADNRFNTQAGLVGDMMSPDGRNAIDQGFLDLVFGDGAPAMTSAGPVAPTLAQAQGSAFNQGTEMWDPLDFAAFAFGDTPVTNVVTPEGPRVSTTYDAVGMEPLVNKGAEAAPKPVLLVDPVSGAQTGGFAIDGQYVLGDGKTPAPPNLVPQNLPQATGSADELGGTTANQSLYDRTKTTVTETRLLVNDLRGLITSQAGAAGAAGGLQMIGQDFIQTGRELAAALNQNPATDGVVTPEMLTSLAALGANYNPVFREIRTGMLQLAYNNAKMNNPSGEVSRFALEREIEALGQGMLGNDQAALAALNMVERNALRKEAAAEALIRKPVPDIGDYNPAAPGVTGTPATRPRAVNPQTGETIEWDGTQWAPVQ